MRKLAILIVLFFACSTARGQLYTGLSGLLQTPSAEMYEAGDARLGTYYLNRRWLPREIFHPNKGLYNTIGFYVSLTPFSWMEIGYAFTLFKGYHNKENTGEYGYFHKDQYFSLKVRPLKEGKWWPAVALGTNDPATTMENKGNYGNVNQFFGNFYVSATKHFSLWRQTFGTTLSYRYFLRRKNHRWNGLVGGVTWRPSFYRDLRAIVEWTGDAVNIGVDCLLFRHLLLQASLYDGRGFSAGLCYTVNLF